MKVLLTFPLFALVVAPFVITYIASERGPDHTPDWPLAFGVEAAWLLFILVVGGLVGQIQKARAKK